MISKAVLCHILVIWGLAQVTAQVSMNRQGIPAGVRSSMIANGWRPLTGYDGKASVAQHSSSGVNAVGSSNERRTVLHQVHGKHHEHMVPSELSSKLSSKPSKQSHDYSAQGVLGGFGVFGHSMPKVRPGGESSKSGHPKQVAAASETREFSFLVPPPPRDPLRYEVEPFRKIILRDNEAYLRQPQQYIISHPGHQQQEIRNPQYYPKGSATSNAHSKNRPTVTEYNVGVQPSQQQQVLRPQQAPFESLKLSNAKLYLQPPSANGPLNFASEQQQATENLYDRYPSSLPPNTQLSQEGPGNFYSQISHPSPTYKSPHNLERDPSFLVHESHEVSYVTPATQENSYSNYRPSSPYESLHPPERYSTPRPQAQPSTKFVPSKPDNVFRQQNPPYVHYPQSNGNLDNSISTEQHYANGIANTYYITEQQSLTPPPATWSLPAKSKVTSDINEVLPKANRPAKFNEPPSVEQYRQSGHQQVVNYLFSRPEVQQPQQQPQHYPSPLALINQPEVVYETPESISLKHFNEQQFKLQQQLLQRDRDRLREQELQRDRLREQELQRQQEQIDLGRLAAVRNQEQAATPQTRPTPEPTRTTVEYFETTVDYGIPDNRGPAQVVQEIPAPQIFPQQYQSPYAVQNNFEPSLGYDAGNESLPEAPSTTEQPRQTTEAATAQRTRSRKPSTAAGEQRRRKPTTPSYEDRYQYSSTLTSEPEVQTLGISFSYPTSTETTVSEGLRTIGFSPETTVPTTTTTTTTTTTRPRTRRPSSGSGSGGRRRRPTTTTTEEPDTTVPVTYEQKYEDVTRYEKTESEASRRRRVKPSTTSTTSTRHEEADVSPTTSTEKKRYEIQNYGNKLGNEPYTDFVTEAQGQTVEGGVEVEQVSQQAYGFSDEREREALFYTPSYDAQVTTGQEYATEYETSGYPTSATVFSTQGSKTEYGKVDEPEAVKSVYTNIPLEELFVSTERSTTTTTTTTTTTPAPRRTTTAATTRLPIPKSTLGPSTTAESVSTRAPSHRIRPMRFGNTTRPRFSIKDYKSRLDYRSRMSTTTSESPVTSAPTSSGRQKFSASKTTQLSESQPESTTSGAGRYRHMSRVSYRLPSTTPSHHSRRTDLVSGNSTTERTNKFAPKRRVNNNHLYRSKTSTSTTVEPARDDEPTSRQSPVRHENVYSSSIRRRPQMKHSVYTQSSDLKSTRKDSTEMVPEETSFYSPSYSQLLVTEAGAVGAALQDFGKVHIMRVTKNDLQDGGAKFIVTPSSQTETSNGVDVFTVDAPANQTAGVEASENSVDHSPATTASSNDDGRTEALKSDFATVDSQLEEDLFARASQSVADLTSSASALYNKPGMFKAVSVSPSAPDAAAISNRFKIGQEKPTLPIEAFFHELTSKN